MAWKIIIHVQTENGLDRHEDQVPTPHLHVAIDTVLYRHGLSNAKAGSYQITAEAI